MPTHNPAGQYVTFRWKLVHLEGAATFQVFDSFGREVVNQPA
ncbi:MAG: hypothetical protein R3B93_11250 [Bacteroidia bacterium]